MVHSLVRKKISELENIAKEFGEDEIALILSVIASAYDENVQTKLATHLIEFASELHEN